MNRNVLLAGCLVVLLILILDLASVFGPLDARTRDLQQQHIPRESVPMTSDIVHVDIDDGALQRIGRWPWSRTLIAECIKTLRSAGARTIAVDLEFSEPSSDPADDLALADAIEADTVLAVLNQEDALDRRWNLAGGTDAGRQHIQELLQTNIDLNPDTPIEGVSDADRTAFAANELALKRAVLWADSQRDHPEGLAEQALLAAYQRQARAEAIARERGLMNTSNTVTGSPMDRLPLPELVEQGGGLGYVHISHRDNDGVVRSIEPLQASRVGEVPSLGAAAALLYMEQDPSGANFEVIDNVLNVRDVIVLPMHNKTLPLAWPYTEHGVGWQHLLRRQSTDAVGTGHLSIGTIAELVRAREMQTTTLEQLSRISLDLLRVLRQDATLEVENSLDESVQAEIADDWDFTLGDIDATDTKLSAVFEDPDALAHAEVLQSWRALSDAATAGAKEISWAQEALHELVNDKLVFIGWTATGSIADFVPTVAGPRTPGVVVHAATANMLLTGRMHLHAPWWVGPLLVIVLGLWVVLLVASTTPLIATACSLLLLAVYVYLASMLSFASWNLFLPIIAPTTSGLSAWAVCTGTSAILIQRDKRRITRQFRARVSDRLVDALIDRPHAVSMDGVRREITVLFADLAGFTSMSERLDSAETVALANRALSAMADSIIAQDGYVNKFLGDGLMAFWSAFDEQPDQAALACRAAEDCLRAIGRLDEPLGVRLGISTGEAIVGDCGAPPELNDYTAIGDTVNLAARLESANRFFGTSILLDQSTHAQIDSGIRTLPIGPVVVVGQSTPVQLHAIISEDIDEDAVATAEALQQAVHDGDRTAATAALQAMGRHAALGTLQAAWAETIESGGELVLRLSSK